MGWKDLPSWLKGGIIGIVLFFIGILNIYLFDNRIPTFLSIILGLSLIPGLLLKLFFIDRILISIFSLTCDNFKIHCPSYIDILSFIILFFIYFLVSALIGWIVGKIKSGGKKQ